MYKMVDPDRYCGGANELDNFISHLQQNFESHTSLFPRGGIDKVNYALNFLGSWAKHPDPTLRKSKMTDPAQWGRSLRISQHSCLQDFDLFKDEIRKIYGDKDRAINAAIRAMQEYTQGALDPDETVRAYGNWIRSTWREAGWNEEMYSAVFYDMMWAGLKPYLRGRIKPLASNGRFATLDE